MQKHYNYLNIDLDSSKIYRKLSAMQGDIKSRYILVNLYSNNLAYDLTNCNVKIYGIKKDTTVFFNNAVIIDALKGQFEIELTNQALAVSGELKIQILILGATGEKLTSSAFFINVGESIVDENAIESTNEFNALTEGLAGLVEYDIYKQNVSAHEEKLIQHDAQFNTIATEKATKQEVDVERQRINNFTSLAEGSTTGDAELIDGRIAIDGATHPNIGDAIRTQVYDMTYDIYNLDKNGIKTLRLNESDLEFGNINYSTGALETHNVIRRTKNYINLEVGEIITVNVKNGNGVNLIFYDENGNWKVSRAVSATQTTNTRTLTVEYPKMKVAYLYYSSSYPIYASNCLILRKSEIQKKIDSLWGYVQDGKIAESHDFNNLIDGAYWLNVSSSQNDLVNAPCDYTYGNFSVLTKLIGDYYIQFAFTTYNNLSQKRGFFRLFNSSSTVIRWSDLNIMFHKSQDNYVAFGDSITHGYQKTVDGVDIISNYQYWKTIGSILKLNATEGANTGSGFVKVQGNKNALRIIDEYDFTNVNLVSFAFGTNDWNANIPLGTINDSPINGNVNTNGTYTNNTNTIYSAIKYCVERALSQNPQMTLILITPINRSQVGSSGATLTKENNWGYGAINTAGYTLGDVCKATVDVAKYYGIPYIDNREGNPINRLTVNSLTVDGLHFTDWGYMKLGQFYAGKIGSIYRPYEI